MNFGVWYGVAMWFVFLKGLGVSPFVEWSWWLLPFMVAYPSLSGLFQVGECLRSWEGRLGRFVHAYFR